MKLIFFRHAEAQKKHPGDSELEDFRRVLLKKGSKHAREMVKACAFLWKGNLCIFTSSYPRAVQTAEILHKKFPKCALEMTTALDKFTDAEEMVKKIRALPDGTYTFVGHEPQFSELIGKLLTGRSAAIISPPKAGVVVLEGKTLRELKLMSVLSPEMVLRI